MIADHGYFDFGSNTWQNFGLQVLLNDGSGNFATSIFYPFDPGHEEPYAVALARSRRRRVLGCRHGRRPSQQYLALFRGRFGDSELHQGRSIRPTHAGESFVVAGSLAGTLPSFDVGGVHVPLNQDAYFQLTLNLGGVPPFIGFAGTLDANGRGTAQFSLPPGTPGVLAGLTIHHAFATLAPGVNFASNAVSVSLLP